MLRKWPLEAGRGDAPAAVSEVGDGGGAGVAVERGAGGSGRWRRGVLGVAKNASAGRAPAAGIGISAAPTPQVARGAASGQKRSAAQAFGSPTAQASALS